MDEIYPVSLNLNDKHYRAANDLAKRWATNRSEAIRRAIEIAARGESVWGDVSPEQWEAFVAEEQRKYEANRK
jgi:hypothetical protein